MPADADVPSPKPRRPAGSPPRRTASGAERPPGVRELAARATRDGILRAATRIFAKNGYDGGKVDQISKAAKSYDRMIYYYFGSKEGLYLAVLEQAYARMRAIESQLDLDNQDPESALRRLVEFTFDHHASNENYIRLVVGENINRGQFLAQSKTIQQLNVPAISSIQKLYTRGVAAGVFRPGLDAVDIHASISALTFFNVSNRHTFGLIFKRDFTVPSVITLRRAAVVDMVVRYVRADLVTPRQ